MVALVDLVQVFLTLCLGAFKVGSLLWAWAWGLSIIPLNFRVWSAGLLITSVEGFSGVRGTSAAVSSGEKLVATSWASWVLAFGGIAAPNPTFNFKLLLELLEHTSIPKQPDFPATRSKFPLGLQGGPSILNFLKDLSTFSTNLGIFGLNLGAGVPDLEFMLHLPKNEHR